MKSCKRLWASNLRWLFVIVSCLAAAAAFSLRPTMAQVTNQSAASQNIPGHPPQLVQDGTAQLAGPFASSQKLRLVIGLQPPNVAEEEKFLADLQNKASPQFHRFLTADQWNQRFAPSVKDEQAVVDWAKSQGLTVTNRYPNRLLVDVEAPVSVIQSALGVTINSYKVNSETFFSNDQPPAIPPALSGIVHSVEGLNNLERMHGSMKGVGNISQSGLCARSGGGAGRVRSYRRRSQEAAGVDGRPSQRREPCRGYHQRSQYHQRLVRPQRYLRLQCL